MKPFLILLHALLVLSRIETNEATRTLDETHLLLPSLQIRPPVKTPTPNPRTEASVNMASRVTERNFVGRKEVVFASPTTTTTNAYPLEETHLLLPSLQTHAPVKTPTPNPETEASVNMTSKVIEKNFVGRKEVDFAPPPPPPPNAYPPDETHFLPSLQTHPPVKTPTPNSGTEASKNMASRVTERNFVGRKEVVFDPPHTNTYPLDESHFLLPSLQTRPPVKTPTPNPGTEASVNMASRVIEKNFAGRKEVYSTPTTTPTTNTYSLDETHFILPSLQTCPPFKTPIPNPGTRFSVNMASRVTEKNFVGCKEVDFASPHPPPSNAHPLDETHFILPFLETRPPVKTPITQSRNRS